MNKEKQLYEAAKGVIRAIDALDGIINVDSHEFIKLKQFLTAYEQSPEPVNQVKWPDDEEIDNIASEQNFITEDQEGGFKIGMRFFREFYSGFPQQNEQPVKSEWISVKDRLPEIGETVLTYLFFQGITISRRAYDYETKIQSNDIRWFKGTSENKVMATVLFWMPLPDQPTK
jgi:hypothetical protein